MVLNSLWLWLLCLWNYCYFSVANACPCVGAKHMALNYWWRPYQWEANSKKYEAEQLGLLRDTLLDKLTTAGMGTGTGAGSEGSSSATEDL